MLSACAIIWQQAAQVRASQISKVKFGSQDCQDEAVFCVCFAKNVHTKVNWKNFFIVFYPIIVYTCDALSVVTFCHQKPLYSHATNVNNNKKKQLFVSRQRRKDILSWLVYRQDSFSREDFLNQLWYHTQQFTQSMYVYRPSLES